MYLAKIMSGVWLLLVPTLVVAYPARAADSRHSELFEPTVTRQEADVLRQAEELSEGERAAAIALVREELADTSSPAMDFALGNFLYQAERLDEAEQAYLFAVAKMPTFRRALNNLARIYFVQEKPRKAMNVFQGLVRAGQGDAQTLLLLGHCLLLLDKPVQAEGAYRQSLVLEPDDVDAMRGLIKTLIGQQRNAEVLALTKTLQIELPYDAELWNLRANAHLSLHQHAEAVTSLESARLLDCATPRMLVSLGDLYLHREQPRDAVAVYQQAFSAGDPNGSQVMRAVEGFLLIEASDEAERLLDRIRSDESSETLSPDDRLRRDKLEGRLAAMRGNHDEARRLYTSIIRQDPLAGDAMISLAGLHRASGEQDEARMYLERASRIEGFEARALVRQAELEVEQGHFPAAVQLLESAQTYEEQAHVGRYLEQVRRIDLGNSDLF